MITENLKRIKAELPQSACLVAVSKTKPIEMIQAAYETGHLDFGENKVQDLVEKYETLPKDIRWHFIGHLQTNKVKYIAPFIHLLHGVDSLKLLKAINKEALKNDRIIDCLLQVKIADEDSKFGLSMQAVHELLLSEAFRQLHNVRIIGLMGMSTNTRNVEQVTNEFKGLKAFFDKVGTTIMQGAQFNVLSMGMSNDYLLALSCGSNMVRVGSSIFGARVY